MAEYGLRITHTDKSVYTLTPADRITRVCASISTGTDSRGSAYISEWNNPDGEKFFFLVPEFQSGNRYSNLDVWIDGARVRWAFQEPSYATNYVVHCGLY